MICKKKEQQIQYFISLFSVHVVHKKLKNNYKNLFRSNKGNINKMLSKKSVEKQVGRNILEVSELALRPA